MARAIADFVSEFGDEANLATKGDIAELRDKTAADMQSLREETRSEFRVLREEMRGMEDRITLRLIKWIVGTVVGTVIVGVGTIVGVLLLRLLPHAS
jgi:hypothetical protein